MRSNFGGVYIINRLPKGTLELKDTFGTEIFKDIVLETEYYEMEWLEFEGRGIKPHIEDALKETVKEILLILRKTYGIEGLKDTNREILFEDGKVIRNVESNERRNTAKFNIIVHFKYHKDIWNKIDNIILELDDLENTWEKIEFRTERKFDFRKVETLCMKNDYKIDDFDLTSPKFVNFLTDYFADKFNLVSVSEYDDYSSVSVKPEEVSWRSPYLDQHFYTLINPKKVNELCIDMLSE